jgi:hypothetical protein
MSIGAVMGIARMWRLMRVMKAAARAANESAAAQAPEQGSPGLPRPSQGLMGGLFNVMSDVLNPQLGFFDERRGGPLPGSDIAVIDGSAWRQPLAVQAARLRARDAAFDGELLASFAEQVFAAVMAAWKGADAGSVRAVMSDALWEPLAGATALPGSPGIFARFAQIGEQRPAARLTGLHTGGWYDSAQVTVDVTLGGELPAGMPARMTAWDEEWLFQRSVQPGGDPMIRPQACPACGASARAADQDLCPHCRAPVPYLTTGWLVTQIVSRHPASELMRERRAQAMRAQAMRARDSEW